MIVRTQPAGSRLRAHSRRRGMTMLEALLALAVALVLFSILTQLMSQIAWAERASFETGKLELTREAVAAVVDSVSERWRMRMSRPILNSICRTEDLVLWDIESSSVAASVAGDAETLCVLTNHGHNVFGVEVCRFSFDPDGILRRDRYSLASIASRGWRSAGRLSADVETGSEDQILTSVTGQFAYTDGNSWFRKWPAESNAPLRAIRIEVRYQQGARDSGRELTDGVTRSFIVCL